MSLTDGLLPALLDKVNLVLAAMTALRLPMKVCQGVRTAEYEHALWLLGRDAQGHVTDAKAIVTNCDGYCVKSNHQQKEDGFGHAVDCCFVGADPFLKADSLAVLKWRAYGAAGKAVGLRWGGDFTSPIDDDHLELL